MRTLGELITKGLLGDTLMKVLLVEYLIISAVFLYERHWSKALYFLGAATVTFAILWGME